MMAANYRHIGDGENRLGRHYSRFSRIWPTAFVGDQSLALRKSLNGGSNRRRRASGASALAISRRRGIRTKPAEDEIWAINSLSRVSKPGFGLAPALGR